MYHFDCKAQVDGEAKRFTILANTGARMSFWDEDVIIKEGAKIQKLCEQLPILYAHDRDKPLGYIEAITQDGADIYVSGKFCFKDADEIIAAAKNGYQWQASIGFDVLDFDCYEQGEVEVNGRTEKVGKKSLFIAKEIKLWECSICVFGADSATKVKIEAQKQLTEKVQNMDNNIERMKELMEVAGKYDAYNQVNEAYDAGMSGEAFELQLLRNKAENEAKALPAVSVKQTGKAKAGEVLGVLASRAVHGSFESLYSAEAREEADKLAGYDFRACFEELTGFRPTREQQINGRSWVEAASTYNLQVLVADTANSVLLSAFNSYEQPWRDVFKVSAVNDFRKNARYRIASDFKYSKIERGGTAPLGKMDDSKWEIQADSYGIQEELAYQDIVDGNALNVFGDILQRMAYGAQQTIADACWKLFLNPSADSDSNAFYSAAHNNVFTGELTLENLALACKAFETRSRGFGADASAPLNLRPTTLIVPPSLEFKAEMLLKAATLNRTGDMEPTGYNPMANYGWKIVSTAELESSAYTNASSTAWYIASPAQLPAFEIAFVGGRQAPVMRQHDCEIGTRGIKMDAYIDFGVAQQDWRGIMKCAPAVASTEKAGV